MSQFYAMAIFVIIIGLAGFAGTSEKRKSSNRRKAIRKLYPERYNAMKRANRMFWLKELGLWLAGLTAIGLLATAIYFSGGV